ncbi:MAG: hypothetical protein OER86_10290, partial [Phycisphaerae bacterium]|nr:hypothetical protein [Phycisphaerae bacterium]
MTDILFPAMTWRPVLPVLQIGAITVVLAALAIWAYARVLRAQPWRATGLLFMRLAGLAALATLLLGPSRLPAETTRPGRPDLLVMLDLSASMLTEDADETARIAYLKRTWLRPEQWKKLAADFNLHLLGFDQTGRALDYQTLQTPDAELATGRVSLYAESITDQLLNLPTTAANAMMLVLGDGHDSEDQPLQAAAALARARQVRIHTVSVGSAASPADLALVALPRQPYLMVDEPGEVTVKIYRAGTAGDRAVVHLRQGEKDEKHEVDFKGGDSVTLSLPLVQDKPGLYAYEIEVEPLADEVVTDNNRQKIFVEVTERRLRVLLLEGEPFWDTKFLAQSLRSDA